MHDAEFVYKADIYHICISYIYRAQLSPCMHEAEFVHEAERELGAAASKVLHPLHNAVHVHETGNAAPLGPEGILPSIHDVLGSGLQHSHRRPTRKGSGAQFQEPSRVVVLRVGGGTKSPPPEILKTPLLDSTEVQILQKIENTLFLFHKGILKILQ